MTDIKRPFCDDDCEGERGERGERGKRGKRGQRGHRGHDGHEGRDGDTGPTGATGPTGPTGATGAIGATGATGSGGVAELIAAALVNSTGEFPPFASHPGFSSVVHTGIGVYTLTMTNFPADGNNLIINATLGGMVGGEIVWVGGVAPNTIVVRTFDSAGVPADRVFTITAFDTTP